MVNKYQEFKLSCKIIQEFQKITDYPRQQSHRISSLVYRPLDKQTDRQTETDR